MRETADKIDLAFLVMLACLGHCMLCHASVTSFHVTLVTAYRSSLIKVVDSVEVI